MERRGERPSDRKTYIMAYPVSNYERIIQTPEFKSMNFDQQNAIVELERVRLREARRIVQAIEKKHSA